MSFALQLKNNRGFSLLELLIYMAILAGFLVVLVNLFFMISASSSREEARAEVRQNLRFAAQQITTDIRSATAISAPIVGGEGNALNITVGGEDIAYAISGGVLQRTRGAITENITTAKISVSNPSAAPFIFTRDNSGIRPTVQIILEMSYNDNGRADYKFSDKLQTTASLKQ